MSRIGNSTPGSWYDQGRPEEAFPSKEAIERDVPIDPTRTNLFLIPLAFIALAYAVALVIWLVWTSL